MKTILLLLVVLTHSCKTSESESKSVIPKSPSQPVTVENYVDPLWNGTTVNGVVQLSLLRDKLIQSNLIDSYTSTAPTFSCPDGPLEFRSTDGSCYLKKYPFAGAANTRFGRNVPLKEAVVDRTKLLSPNPRVISQELMTRKAFIPVESVNLLVAGWIQFMIHDWILHAKSPSHRLKVPLEKNNPFGRSTMDVPSTPSDRQGTESHESSLNTVTSWWDGSQIYGSSASSASKVRTFAGGRLKIGGDGYLPVDPATGQEVAGVSDNWWIGLSLFHHIFTKEHNRIAGFLSARYPDYTDEKIYQISRLINAALMAKIHTVEWTPAVLQHPIMNFGMNANWYGLSKSWDSPTKMLSALMPSHIAFLHGIVGQPVTRDFGVPYSLTEEFTTVYRMHQFLPDTIEVMGSGKKTSYELGSTIRQQSLPLLKRFGLESWIYSFASQSPGALVLNNYPKALQNIAMPDSMNLDLAAVDILRDRERGVPKYNTLRKYLLLPPAKTFSDINSDGPISRKMQALYRSVDDVDAIVGMLAEDRRPSGFAFGETQFRIFLLMASRRLFSDPFYTERYNEKYYTKEGIKWVEDNSLSTIIHAHFPTLRNRVGIEENAFLKWNK